MGATATLLLLRKVMVLRRLGDQPIGLNFLLKALEDDEELVRTKRPELYVNGTDWDMAAVVRECVEDGTADTPRLAHGSTSVVRTRLGEQFMRTLEPGLVSLADDAPMSQKNLLEWLAIVS